MSLPLARKRSVTEMANGNSTRLIMTKELQGNAPSSRAGGVLTTQVLLHTVEAHAL